MEYQLFDTHCDVACAMMANHTGLREGGNQFSLKKLEKYQKSCQFYAIYVSPVLPQDEAKRYAPQAYELLMREFEQNSDLLRFCTTYEDAQKAAEEGRHAAFLSLENSAWMEGDPKKLAEYREKGVRLVSLTHRLDNLYGCGNDTQDDTGLTELGKRFTREIYDQNLLFDVSHLSFKSFWDAAEIAGGRPIVASHSSAYAVCPHVRNLTDEQFGVIRDSGGYVGVNLYEKFLREQGRCTVEDVIRHLEHFFELGGEKLVGFGADLDGIDLMPEGMTGVDGMYLIADEMVRRNYPSELIEGVFYQNGMDFLKKVL